MTREAVIFGVSGACFGLLVGWILGSQQAGRPAQASVTAQASGPPSAGNPQAPPPLDAQRVRALEQQAGSRPGDAAVRVELANLFYDAQRFEEAIPWYEAALKISPADIDVSTDLAVCYYYTNKADRALAQIDRSLAIDPNHPKTLLNQGIIRAFGKEDLAGARASWEKVVQVAPGSPEAARAKRVLEGLGAAPHPPGTGGAGRSSGRGGQ